MKAYIFDKGNDDPYGKKMIHTRATGPGRVGITGAISGPYLYILYTADNSQHLHIKVVNWQTQKILVVSVLKPEMQLSG